MVCRFRPIRTMWIQPALSLSHLLIVGAKSALDIKGIYYRKVYQGKVKKLRIPWVDSGITSYPGVIGEKGMFDVRFSVNCRSFIGHLNLNYGFHYRRIIIDAQHLFLFETCFNVS